MHSESRAPSIDEFPGTGSEAHRSRVAPRLRWIFGVLLPLACFVTSLVWLGGLPTDRQWPRAAVLVGAACSMGAMAVSTRRLARGRAPSMVVGGLLAFGTVFAAYHVFPLGFPGILAALFFWPLLPLAIAPLVAVPLYGLAAIHEVASAHDGRSGSWLRFALGLLAPMVLAAVAAQALQRTESLLLARLVEPERELDERRLAPLRAVGWLDDWGRIQRVRAQWVRADPPGYSGRTLRARQVLHALTGRYDGAPPGAD